MNVVTSVCFGLLATSGALCLVRVVRTNSSLADRIIGLDSVLVVLVGAVAVLTARTGNDSFIEVAVVAALLGFVGTITVARYIERRGA
jgi:multicomponent Na+:H+ antiporter subunit F